MLYKGQWLKGQQLDQACTIEVLFVLPGAVCWLWAAMTSAVF